MAKPDNKKKDWMKLIGTCSDFNYEQYEIEHTPTEENILIRAGAGTGKTYAMISPSIFYLLCSKYFIIKFVPTHCDDNIY